MSGGLACKSATKSNEKLVNLKYAALLLSCMPFVLGICHDMTCHCSNKVNWEGHEYFQPQVGRYNHFFTVFIAVIILQIYLPVFFVKQSGTLFDQNFTLYFLSKFYTVFPY